MKAVGLTFTPLMRYHGFVVKNGLSVERFKWPQWFFQKSFSQASYQEFNKRKYMDLINSFRDTDSAKVLINETIKTYKQNYKELGLIR